ICLNIVWQLTKMHVNCSNQVSVFQGRRLFMGMETTGHRQEAADRASVLNSLPKLGDMMMFRLYRAWAAGNPIFTRLCEGRFNITRREWRLLAIAVQHDRLTSTEMTHAVGLDGPRTSRAVGTLCNKGLLERRRDSGD